MFVSISQKKVICQWKYDTAASPSEMVNGVNTERADQKYGVFIEADAQDDEAYFSDVSSVVAHIARFVS